MSSQSSKTNANRHSINRSSEKTVIKSRNVLNKRRDKSDLSSADSDRCESEWDEIEDERLYAEELSRKQPQGTNKIPKFLSSALKGMPEKWSNYIVRGIFAIIMISGFCLLIYIGPLALIGLVLFIQVKCFQEIMAVGYRVYQVDHFPWIRHFSSYLLLMSNYFCYGEHLFDYVGPPINHIQSLHFLITYHRFISFCLYCIGFIFFVILLVKRKVGQFHLFAWAHVAILITVVHSYFMIRNIFEGLIWFIAPVVMIIMNDIMAYLFGFFFGKTPLIQLSPKKTWEGYIGGGITTVLFGFILSYILCQYPYFLCPVDYSEEVDKIVILDCKPSYLFTIREYHINFWTFHSTLHMQPFMWHSFSLSIFISIISPFGGFFASGFKRAFRIKDFGDTIPGHGGIMDRFDCQVLTAAFVYAYIYSFIRSPSPQRILTQILKLKPEEQLSFYYQFENYLNSQNIG